MPEQLPVPVFRRFARLSAASLLLLMPLSCGDGPSSAVPGIRFPFASQDLGTLTAGEEVELRFAFEVGADEGPSPVPERLEASCGCLNPRLVVDGKPFPFGLPLPAGSNGEVVVDFITAGFEGKKRATVQLLGVGQGLPAELEVRCFLEPWFRMDPTILELGILPILQENPFRTDLQMHGPEPFRILKVTGLPRGVAAAPLPSPNSALSQSIQLSFPPDLEEGKSTAFLRLHADNGLSAVVPLAFEVAGRVWLRPGRLLPIGVVAAGREIQATVDLGVREGTLGEVDVKLTGFPGGRAECLILEEGRSCRILLTLPSDLPAGPFHGLLQLRLPVHQDGEEEILEREVKILGLIKS